LLRTAITGTLLSSFEFREEVFEAAFWRNEPAGILPFEVRLWTMGSFGMEAAAQASWPSWCRSDGSGQPYLPAVQAFLLANLWGEPIQQVSLRPSTLLLGGRPGCRIVLPRVEDWGSPVIDTPSWTIATADDEEHRWLVVCEPHGGVYAKVDSQTLASLRPEDQ